ncbi:pitrilysin family protein [Anaeromyxobacter sp. PSR-1]|uniref:M16 family metallopeptidase n=1 Tax=Anaeromyxobacter sp. PSR-1 TaxID=1300915 RepID=UPI0005E99552|nr:M16 family metallopeptidase [Anaeromyxobacter sp. PSR-1]GAO04233.1 putative zinc protease y4wA [Anaeromyxobacter sp. PSR-1]
MRTRPLVAAFLVASAVLACAPVKPVQMVKAVPYEGFAAAYPTGMRLVAYALPHMPTVMVSASYQVGSVDDPPGKEGLAHLVEHLSFRARTGGGATLWSRLLATGAEFNGFTQDDSTDYYEIGQPDQLDELLRLEADRLRDPLAGVDEAAFARERAVVAREMAERHAGQDEPRQLDWLRARALPGSPYARAASAESVARITLEDVRGFVRRHYTPASVILVVTGPEPGASVSARALRAMGALANDGAPARLPVAFRPPRPDLTAPVARDLEVREAPVDRPVLWLAWSMPGDADRGVPRALAAEEYVRRRLSWMQYEHAGLVRSVDTTVDRMDGVALVVAQIELTRREDAQAVLDAFRSVRRFWRGLGAGADLDDDAKRWIRDNLLLRSHLRLEALEVADAARYFRTTGEPDFVGGWQKQVAVSLTTDSKEYVERYLDDARAAALLVVPGGRAAAGPVAGVAAGADHHGPAPEEPGVAVPPVPAMRAGLARAERRRLPNGLEVVVAYRPGFRAVDARLVFRRDPGLRSDADLQYLASLASPCGIAGRIAHYNVLRATPDSLFATIHYPSDLVDQVLVNLSCRASQMTFDAPVFERLRTATVQELDRRPPGQSENERAGALLLTRVFPGEPFGVVVDAARVRGYATSAAKRFHDATFRPDRASLIIAGNVQPTPELWSRIEQLYGGWRGLDATPPAALPAVPLPARRQVVVMDRPGAQEARITLGLRIPPRALRDDPATRVLVDVMERGLFEDLRVRRALTYGVSPALIDTVRGSALFLDTTVEARQARDAVQALLDALAAGTRGIPQEPLDRAKLRVFRDHLRQFGTSARDGGMIAEAFVQGLPADEWDTFGDRLRSVTPQRVQAAAQAAALDREVILVAGDAATLAPALRAAGLEPEVVAARPAPAAR